MKKNKQKKEIAPAVFPLFLILAFVFLPMPAFAQVTSLPDFINLFNDFNLMLIPIAFSAGLLFFIWRGAMYILHSGSEEAKSEGRRVLLWGVIALFIMASFYGIIRFFQKDTGIIYEQIDLPIQPPPKAPGFYNN